MTNTIVSIEFGKIFTNFKKFIFREPGAQSGVKFPPALDREGIMLDYINMSAGIRLFETLVAKHCAPVLLGKKPAALFPRPPWWDESVSRLSLRGMCFFMLPTGVRNGAILAYRPNMLSGTLENTETRTALRGLGYPEETRIFKDDPVPAAAVLASQLRYLAKRFRESEEFPHEIGFFLGYPPEDVLGFIRHRGACCKLCGVWKVYSDVEKASLLFREYARCRQRLLEYIQKGGTIFDENFPAMPAG
jgi:hypothetical protein